MPLSPPTWTPKRPAYYYKWLSAAQCSARDELHFQKTSGLIWDDEWNCYRQLPKKIDETRAVQPPVKRTPKTIRKPPSQYFQNKLKFKRAKKATESADAKQSHGDKPKTE